MSQENVEVVRRIYEIAGKALRDHAFPERDAREVFDPKLRLDLSRNVFNPGVYEGIDGLRETFENIWEVWEQFEVHPREFVESADKVAVVVEMRGRAREGV